MNRHEIVRISKDGEKVIKAFRVQRLFSKTAMDTFRKTANYVSPIVTFVKNESLAGGYYRLHNGDVLELR